jgi:hypothetical protein
MGDFHRHVFTLMTGKAQFSSLFGEEERILRGMGIVAGITLSLLKRYVLHVTTSLEICWFMALVTELAAFFCGLERFLGRWRVVALFAGAFDHHGMHARFQELGL